MSLQGGEHCGKGAGEVVGQVEAVGGGDPAGPGGQGDLVDDEFHQLAGCTVSAAVGAFQFVGVAAAQCDVGDLGELTGLGPGPQLLPSTDPVDQFHPAHRATAQLQVTASNMCSSIAGNRL